MADPHEPTLPMAGRAGKKLIFRPTRAGNRTDGAIGSDSTKGKHDRGARGSNAADQCLSALRTDIGP